MIQKQYNRKQMVSSFIFAAGDTTKTYTVIENDPSFTHTITITLPNFTTAATATFSITSIFGNVLYSITGLAKNATYVILVERPIQNGSILTLTLNDVAGGSGGTSTVIIYPINYGL